MPQGCCPRCGRAGFRPGILCPGCSDAGSGAAHNTRGSKREVTRAEESGETFKLAAVGVFLGCLVAAAVLLCMVLRGNRQSAKPAASRTQQDVMSSPLSTGTQSTPEVEQQQDDEDLKRQTPGPGMRSRYGRRAYRGSEDLRSKKTDTFAAPGKPPKMTEYQ